MFLQHEEREDSNENVKDTSLLTSAVARLVVFRNPEFVRKLDLVLRALYPSVFLLFVIVYTSVVNA